MPYAFLTPAGEIKQVFAKPSPFMRLGDGERMVNYNPPAHDPELETVAPVFPIEGLDVQFTITPKDAAVYEEVQTRRKSALVQYHLDTAAQRRGYDNMLAAVSYAGSGHPVYDAEGVAFRNWRSECWDAAFAILDAVFAGTRQMPTDAEFISELPPCPLA